MTPFFAAIVRTTGSRPDLLLDALQSLSLQACACQAVVVVHGSEEAHSAVKRTCRDSAPIPTILHVRDVTRRRGHPINVGLDYCAKSLPGVKFLFFLDDDDIVYPFYTSTMSAAFASSEADVIYAGANRRLVGQLPEPGYAPIPIFNVFVQNFIPINSYAIRHSALLSSGVRMSEELDYTEDWYFLLRLLQAGLKFHSLDVTLSEFRLVSDGNLVEKRDPAAWKAISLIIRRFINTSSFPIPGAELVRWANASTAPLAPLVPLPQGAGVEAALENRHRAQMRALQHRIDDLESSLSWRCTAPLRTALGLLLAFGARSKPKS